MNIAPSGMEKVEPGVTRNILKPQNGSDIVPGQGESKTKQHVMKPGGKGLVEYYNNNPTILNLRIESRASVTFPEITVCPSDSLNYTALELHNLTKETVPSPFLFPNELNMTLLEVLNFYTFNDFAKIVDRCLLFSEPNVARDCVQGFWTWINGTQVFTTAAGYWRETRFLTTTETWPLKVCYTFHADTTLPIKLPTLFSIFELRLNFHDLEHNYDTSGYYEIRIDSLEEPFTGMKNVTSSGQTFFLTEGSSYMLSLSVKNYNFLPSGSQCNGDENYDYQKCLETALTEKVFKNLTCSMPSVVPNIPDQTNTQDQCTPLEEFIFFYHYGVALQSYDPGCLRKCKRTVYNVIPFQEAALPAEEHLGGIKLNFPAAELEIVEEQGLTSLPVSLRRWRDDRALLGILSSQPLRRLGNSTVVDQVTILQCPNSTSAFISHMSFEMTKKSVSSFR
ncbi:unnamed protein product [Darwinula stevensoni]|uniref:Uncharacterized protein n=1 Tax=Darwinula stevensoni TaxID=69355 RepID=A0A7R9A644_9CRUS|nr:unnamed protein product [Darwinula stevensoni]CAG0886691.1 unnamed protein product [Darwinula stevensoni]